MNNSETTIQQAKELFEEIRNYIHESMHREFAASNSTTPGLWKQLEEKYDPLFLKIANFEHCLETIYEEHQ